MSNYPDNFSSTAFNRVWSDDDRPGRDDVLSFARTEARRIIDEVKTNFVIQFGNAYDFDERELDFECLVQFIEEASWDVVKRKEDDDENQ